MSLFLFVVVVFLISCGEKNVEASGAPPIPLVVIGAFDRDRDRVSTIGALGVRRPPPPCCRRYDAISCSSLFAVDGDSNRRLGSRSTSLSVVVVAVVAVVAVVVVTVVPPAFVDVAGAVVDDVVFVVLCFFVLGVILECSMEYEEEDAVVESTLEADTDAEAAEYW